MPDGTATVQLTDEQLQAAIEQAGKTPEEVKIELETGEVFKGKSWEEVARSLAQGKTEASKTIKLQKDQLASYEYQRTSPIEETPVSSEKFSQREYLRLWETDPIAAQNYIDAHRFGIQPEQVVSVFQNSVQSGNEFQQYKSLSQFRNNHPEYEGDMDSANNMMKRLQEENRAFDSDNLEIVYNQLVREGSVKVKKQEAETATVTSKRAAPSLETESSFNPKDQDVINNFDNLSTKDQEKVLRKLGMLR